STILGAVAAFAVAVHIGRRRLLRRWHGGPPPVARTPWVFWPVVVAVAAVYPLTWPLLRFPYAAHVQGVRMVWVFALALSAGAAASALLRRSRRTPARFARVRG